MRSGQTVPGVGLVLVALAALCWGVSGGIAGILIEQGWDASVVSLYRAAVGLVLVGVYLAIRPGGSGDVTDTHVVWSAPKGSPFVPAPIIVGDHLFMVNDMISVVTIYDAKSGEVTSQGRLGSSGRESFSAAPVSFDGKVFFTNDDGDTFVLKAGPKVEILHVNSLGERTLASPALVDGRLYIRTRQHLLAIGAS